MTLEFGSDEQYLESWLQFNAAYRASVAAAYRRVAAVLNDPRQSAEVDAATAGIRQAVADFTAANPMPAMQEG